MINSTINATAPTETLFDQLAGLAAIGAQEAQKRRGPVLVSSTKWLDRASALGFFARAAFLQQDRSYWEQPSSGWAMAGAGAAFIFSATGPDRFSRVDADWQALLDGAFIDPETIAQGGPTVIGGFSFDPQRPQSATWRDFPEAMLVLPRFLLRSGASGSWLTTNLVLWPNSDTDAELGKITFEREQLLASSASTLPTPQTALTVEDVLAPEQWQNIVREATATIAAGKLEKVVLAREVLAHADVDLDIDLALRRLRASYPDCFVFAVCHGQSCFLGASPERLVGANNGQASVTCLAGSIKRGETSVEDDALGASLLNSAKNRHEHEVVARMLRQTLEKVCDYVDGPQTPALLKLRNVQHLYTPLRGQLKQNTRLLQVVELLHPTPAVGGTPRAEAMELIRDHERMDRGWYAAPVGWLDASGNGEFAVGLRSALVSGATAHLFAGCGIVADSVPAAEYEESRLKLRPMLGALGSA